MFKRLVASQPVHQRDMQGFLVSTLLHGSVIAAAVLVTATSPLDDVIDEPRVVPIALVRPEPTPTTPMPSRTTPTLPAPVAPDPGTTILKIPVVAPIDVPSTIAAPTDLPWTATVGVSHGVGSSDGLSSGTGVPMPGPSGAYAEAYVDVPAALDARSPLPRYPDALRKWRTEGVARLTFVVDTLGRVEMETVKVIEATHPAFAAAVRAVLPRMRFRAARIGARPVRQLVEFPIVFRLER